jgi:hypothetical protein
MRGKLKTILSAVVIGLAAVAPAFAHDRALRVGPEWYVDDDGLWRSLREDWRNLKRVATSHSIGPRPSIAAAPIIAQGYRPDHRIDQSHCAA